ncbi:MAG: hypothetical protein OWV35_09495, partial [Firmicutes bacterium]|nr:hypothetical protein [Bacillota bacterium]
GQALTGRDLVKPDELLRWPEHWVLTWQAGFAPARLPLPDLSRWPYFAPVAEARTEAPDAQPLVPPPLWDGRPAPRSRREVRAMAPADLVAADDLMTPLFSDQLEMLDWADVPPDIA